jgi:hypothetical protein
MMKLSEKVNSLHQQVQELENQKAELDYELLYAILEDTRENLEGEGE